MTPSSAHFWVSIKLYEIIVVGGLDGRAFFDDIATLVVEKYCYLGEKMFCKYCGAKVGDNANFCSKCGKNLVEEQKQTNNDEKINVTVKLADVKPKVIPKNTSPKSRTIAAVLCFFLGLLGFHRFYVGKVESGVLLLIGTLFGWITGGVLYIVLAMLVLIDLIVILCGNFKDANGKIISEWRINDASEMDMKDLHS